MSSAPAPHGHDAHDDHAFTGEPVQVLAPDEPRTPGWVPLLGIAFFTAAGVMFLASGDSSAKEGAAPAPTANPAAIAQPARPAPAQSTATPRSLTPEQREQLMKQLGQARGAGSAGPAAPRQGPPGMARTRPAPPAGH